MSRPILQNAEIAIVMPLLNESAILPDLIGNIIERVESVHDSDKGESISVPCGLSLVGVMSR